MSTLLYQRKSAGTDVPNQQDIHNASRRKIQQQFIRVAACATAVRRINALGVPLSDALITVVRQFHLDAEETRILLNLF